MKTNKLRFNFNITAKKHCIRTTENEELDIKMFFFQPTCKRNDNNNLTLQSNLTSITYL